MKAPIELHQLAKMAFLSRRLRCRERFLRLDQRAAARIHSIGVETGSAIPIILEEVLTQMRRTESLAGTHSARATMALSYQLEHSIDRVQ